MAATATAANRGRGERERGGRAGRSQPETEKLGLELGRVVARERERELGGVSAIGAGCECPEWQRGCH